MHYASAIRYVRFRKGPVRRAGASSKVKVNVSAAALRTGSDWFAFRLALTHALTSYAELKNAVPAGGGYLRDFQESHKLYGTHRGIILRAR